MPRPISLRAAERHYGVSREWLSHEIAAGRLEGQPIGRMIAVDDGDVRRRLAQHLAELLARELAEEASRRGAARAGGTP